MRVDEFGTKELNIPWIFEREQVVMDWSGVFVVKDSESVPGVFPGQPIRYDPGIPSRFESLVEENWKNQYMVTAHAVDFGGSDPNQDFTCCPEH